MILLLSLHPHTSDVRCAHYERTCTVTVLTTYLGQESLAPTQGNESLLLICTDYGFTGHRAGKNRHPRTAILAVAPWRRVGSVSARVGNELSLHSTLPMCLPADLNQYREGCNCFTGDGAFKGWASLKERLDKLCETLVALHSQLEPGTE